MKPFDLERAKAGDPIRQSHYRDGGPYFDVRFVGVMSDGRIVVERTPNHIATTDASFLVMAPRKKTFYVNLHRRDDGLAHAFIYEDAGEAGTRAANSNNWAGTFPCEIEV